MKLLIITTLLSLLLCTTMYVYFLRKKTCTKDLAGKDAVFYIILMLITALIMKVVGSIYYWERGDMGAFISWMKGLQEDGFSGFYTKHGLAYPPLHIFTVYILGIFNSALGFADNSMLQILLLKSPALICDVLTAGLIYIIAAKHMSRKAGLAGCFIYLLNPAAIFISSVWGQMDSIYTFFIVLMCYLVTEKKLKAAYFAFAASILFKYQGVIFAPVIICAILDQVILNKCTVKKFFSHLLVGLSAILAMVLLHLPFFSGTTAEQSISESYGSAFSSYAYCSVNAYNFWAMLGLNWHTQEDTFLSITYNHWGTIAIVSLVIVSIVYSLFARKKNITNRYFVIGTFVISTMFIYSVRMHERYLFPAIPLVLGAFLVKDCCDVDENGNAHYRKSDIIYYIIYILFSLMNLYNCAHVLFYYNPYAYDPKAAAIVGISAGTVVTWGILVGMMVYSCVKKKNEKTSID